MERRAAGGAVEVRETDSNLVLHGVAIQEGRAARRRREVFAPGSVEWPSEGMGILTRHRGEPEARAVPRREADGRIVIRTPATDPIREAVAAGRRYMSVEFVSLAEGVTEGGIREIRRAFVPDVALVREPEYVQTEAELRRRSGGFRTEIKPHRRRACRCASKTEATVIEIEYDAGAFDRVLREIEGGRRNVSAIARGAGDVVADTATGSLALRRTAGGALGIDLVPLDTEAGRRTRELLDAGVRVDARIVNDFEAGEYEANGPLATIRRSVFSYILVKPTDNTAGLEPLRPARREGRGRLLEPWRRVALL